jgi:hypothetical protein
MINWFGFGSGGNHQRTREVRIWIRLKWKLDVANPVFESLSYGGSQGWSEPAKVDSYYDMPSVSCSSSTFCVAADSVGNELMYNGHAWSVPTNIDAGSA